jgi:hypothetical protein
MFDIKSRSLGLACMSTEHRVFQILRQESTYDSSQICTVKQAMDFLHYMPRTEPRTFDAPESKRGVYFVLYISNQTLDLLCYVLRINRLLSHSLPRTEPWAFLSLYPDISRGPSGMLHIKNKIKDFFRALRISLHLCFRPVHL